MLAFHQGRASPSTAIARGVVRGPRRTPKVSHAPSRPRDTATSSGRSSRSVQRQLARSIGHSIAVPTDLAVSLRAHARRPPRRARRRPGSAGRASSPRRAPCSRCCRRAAAAAIVECTPGSGGGMPDHAEERTQLDRPARAGRGPCRRPRRAPPGAHLAVRARGVRSATTSSRPIGEAAGADASVDRRHGERLPGAGAAHLDRAGERVAVVELRVARLEPPARLGRAVLEAPAGVRASRSRPVSPGSIVEHRLAGRARSARAGCARSSGSSWITRRADAPPPRRARRTACRRPRSSSTDTGRRSR